MKAFVRSSQNYDMSLASVSTSTSNSLPSMTRQADAIDADINTIVRRFGLTGTVPQVPLPPTYQDFESVFDFQSAQNTIRQAQESFNALSADVRNRFNNNPHLFVAFCQNPDNIDDMRKMGLAVPKKEPVPEPPPMRVEVVNPKPSGST